MAGKEKKKKPGGTRSIPLSPETVEALKRQQERFFNTLGRLPGPDDPLFFDPSVKEPRPIIEEVVDHHMLEAMHKAGICPALIYAYQKTGRIVTQDNQKYLTKAQLKEYQDAIDEWHGTHERKS